MGKGVRERYLELLGEPHPSWYDAGDAWDEAVTEVKRMLKEQQTGYCVDRGSNG